MKKNSIEKFLFYLNFIRIIIFRKVFFFFKKIKSKGYINIEVDETFNHSLIRIEYFQYQHPYIFVFYLQSLLFYQSQKHAFDHFSQSLLDGSESGKL